MIVITDVDQDWVREPPQVFTMVRIHHTITGGDIDANSVEDAIRLSDSKYCSVGAMIRQSGAEIVTTYSIQPVASETSEEMAVA